MTSNQIAYWTLQETSRANKAKEAENYRHNSATEGIQNKSTEYTNANKQKELELQRIKGDRDFGLGIANTAGNIIGNVGKAINPFSKLFGG